MKEKIKILVYVDIEYDKTMNGARKHIIKHALRNVQSCSTGGGGCRIGNYSCKPTSARELK